MTAHGTTKDNLMDPAERTIRDSLTRARMNGNTKQAAILERCIERAEAAEGRIEVRTENNMAMRARLARLRSQT
jgi:hypothetical protein